MDLLTITAMLLSVFGMLVLKLVASEIQDWIPTAARRVINQAVERLPANERGRYREEWYAHLDECPGRLGKLWHAIGCYRGAGRIGAALAAPQDRQEHGWPLIWNGREVAVLESDGNSDEILFRLRLLRPLSKRDAYQIATVLVRAVEKAAKKIRAAALIGDLVCVPGQLFFQCRCRYEVNY